MFGVSLVPVRARKPTRHGFFRLSPVDCAILRILKLGKRKKIERETSNQKRAPQEVMK